MFHCAFLVSYCVTVALAGSVSVAGEGPDQLLRPGWSAAPLSLIPVILAVLACMVILVIITDLILCKTRRRGEILQLTVTCVAG